MNEKVLNIVALKTEVNQKYIQTVLGMVEEGNTIPFIARYRKEKTNNLDEDQLRLITQTYDYEIKLFNRKEAVIANIAEKGKLTPELEKAINDAPTMNEVEDLYLPYKEKKKTRASIAIAKGLEPLAKWLLECPSESCINEASKYLNDQVATVEDALQGAMDIIAEIIANDIKNRNIVRNFFGYFGMVKTLIKKDAVDEKKVFELYYDYHEPVRSIANHRILAIDRAENLKILKVDLELPIDDTLANLYKLNLKLTSGEASDYVKKAIDDSFKRLLLPSIENEVRNNLTQRAQEKAIEVFSLNLEQLLLLPPIKNKMMLGVDPAFRTGCKLSVINAQGDFIEKDVIYPHEKYIGETLNPRRVEEAKEKVVNLVRKHHIELIAIGNGTASRETEEFIANTIKEYNLNTEYIIISEAGASVYSASENAKKEFPDLVVEERSAISIARRVQDPLAELIKIDPKSIGIGQYQHDVNQTLLGESLDFTISKVVNNVGVNINTASVELLSYVSGLNKRASQNIVDFRKENGKITNRELVKKIKGIGEKSYEQAIGFLKILDSTNSLDKTFIHPESYLKVINLLKDLGFTTSDIGSSKLADVILPLDEKFGLKYGIDEYSFKDIKEELSRPLRDIRDNYPTPVLRKDVLHIEDLKKGMKLQGTVRSIVDFGVFVDVGLKNDGMIHLSKLTKTRIKHPLEVVSIGDILDVYVIDVDVNRKRIGLSLLKE